MPHKIVGDSLFVESEDIQLWAEKAVMLALVAEALNLSEVRFQKPGKVVMTFPVAIGLDYYLQRSR